MIIYRPQINEEGGEIFVSAKIETQDPKIQLPEKIWFNFPRSCKEYITDRADAFVVAMLPVAMSLNEDIEVQGRVSPRLAYGIEEYQHIQNGWWPKKFKIINVNYNELKNTSEIENKGAVGCSFSGGIDSFYSLWKHMPKKEKIKESRITHCLMINGFDKDVDLNNTGFFKKIQEIYEPMMQSLGIELLIVRTNLQKIRHASIEGSNLTKSFVTFLTTPAMVLGRLFSRFYIPSSYSYGNLIPEGSHPLVDHLFSTESMETIHDGADASRVEKTEILSQWPETYSRLRVCWARQTKFNEKTGYIENCCRCEKCIRTMIALELVGALRNYITFPIPLKRRYIWQTFFGTKGSFIFAKENLKLAIKKGRKDITLDICYAMLQSRAIKSFGISDYVYSLIHRKNEI